MNDQELNLEFYKQRLLAIRQDLGNVKEINSQATQPVELDQTRMGRLSRMDAMQAQAISIASRNRREAQLQQVAAALVRIEKNDYGWCADCGERVDAKRLEFDPTVLFCIDCARKAEP